MVNYPATHFSGNMGSTQIPTSTPSVAFTGGGKTKNCKNLKIKNVDLLYKKHNIMTPQKDIRLVKRQLMALTEVSFPPFSRRYTRSKKNKKSKKSKKSARSGRARKTRRGRKMRGGTTTTGYSIGSEDGLPTSALANPAPFNIYKPETTGSVGGMGKINPSAYMGYKNSYSQL